MHRGVVTLLENDLSELHKMIESIKINQTAFITMFSDIEIGVA